MAKTKDPTEVTLEEAKKAVAFYKSFGGRDSINEYLAPLREFLAAFNNDLSRFDYVMLKVHETLGVEPAIKPIVTTEETK